MVTTKLNLSMTEPSVRQIYAKQGDTGRVLDITLDQTPEDGTLRILRPDGVEVTSEAVTGGEVESGGTFESLAEADVAELTVGIEPVQDLNGYDSPWPAGGGKNIFDKTAFITTSGVGVEQKTDTFVLKALTVGTYMSVSSYIPFTGHDGERVYLKGTVTNSGSNNGYFSVRFYNDSAEISTAPTRVELYPTRTTHQGTVPAGTTRIVIVAYATGSASASVNDTTTFANVILSLTDVTYSPYSNICPITGHDEVRVTRTGKNLLNSTAPSIVDLNGQGANRFAQIFEASGTYTIVNNSASDTDIYYRTPTKDLSDRGTTNGIPTNGSRRVSVDDNHVLWVFRSVNTDMSSFAVNRGTDTAWTPYQGSTYTTSLGQTVYGGTLDMVSGVLTVDKAISVYQGGSDEGWTTRTTSSGYTLFEYYLSNVSVGIPASQVGLCNEFAWNRDLTENIRYRIVNSLLTVRYDGLSLADWKAFLASNPMQVVYPIATPLTYTLTAQQIKTLVGTNNVWASSGDIVSVKFTYGGLLSELPSDATSIVGKCYCDVVQNGVSSMPFTLNIKKNERQ